MLKFATVLCKISNMNGLRRLRKIIGWALGIWGGIRIVVDLLESLNATRKYVASGYVQLASAPSSRTLTVTIIVVGLVLLFFELVKTLLQNKESKPDSLRTEISQRKPRLVWSAFQFVDATYDKDSGIWREQWSEYKQKGFVLQFANLPFDDGKGVPAASVRAQIIWRYKNGSPGPSFFPAAWIDEEYGMVDIPVSYSKKLLIGIKAGIQGSYYWDGYSNPRIDAADRHRLDGQPLPYDGTMLIKLIGATDEVWYEQQWEWKEDLEHGSHPSIRQL
ncbi:MAG TPA: hypothetical protein VEK33_22215 [Terriglobales bacterium]|nr:hypothetical protein [Terriglobales bacterium]